MTTKAKALDKLIDAIAGEDVPMTSQTVAGRLEQLAAGIEDGTISIGGGGGGVRLIKLNNPLGGVAGSTTPNVTRSSLTSSNLLPFEIADDEVVISFGVDLYGNTQGTSKVENSYVGISHAKVTHEDGSFKELIGATGADFKNISEITFHTLTVGVSTERIYSSYYIVVAKQ